MISMIKYTYGPLVKWLTHSPLKATFTSSNLVRVTNMYLTTSCKLFFYLIGKFSIETKRKNRENKKISARKKVLIFFYST